MPETLSTNPGSVESSTWQEPSFPSPLNGVLIFVITTLGGYLQVQYQSKNKSPFEEHDKIMRAISVALSLYGIMLVTEFKLQVHKSSYFSIIKRFTLLMGALVAVLLTIIIQPLFGYFKLLLWIIRFAAVTVASYEEICQCFWQALRHTIEMISGNFGSQLKTRSYVGREEIDLPV